MTASAENELSHRRRDGGNASQSPGLVPQVSKHGERQMLTVSCGLVLMQQTVISCNLKQLGSE